MTEPTLSMCAAVAAAVAVAYCEGRVRLDGRFHALRKQAQHSTGRARDAEAPEAPSGGDRTRHRRR